MKGPRLSTLARCVDPGQSRRQDYSAANRMNSFQLTLTAAQFADAIAKAKAQGVELSPDGGKLPETSGVAMHYSVAQNGDSHLPLYR